MNRDTWFYAYFVFGIVCSFFYTSCSILSLYFFNPLFVSNAFLLEPFVAQALGFAAGLDQMPGILTLVGTVLAISGLVFFYKGS
jgi:hypothetical protein